MYKQLNSNDIILDFGDIKIRLFENINETDIDKLIRHEKCVTVSRSRIIDKEQKFRGMLSVANSTITIHENDFDKLSITTSDGSTIITKPLLELSDIVTTPLTIEPFIFSKKDEYYNINFDILKYDYDVTIENINKPATIITDATCSFEPSIKFQEKPLLNRDDTTGENDWILLKNNDTIRLYDTIADNIVNNTIVNMYNDQRLVYRCFKTIKTYYSVTQIEISIALNKRVLKQLVELFRLQCKRQLTTVLGTMQFIGDDITLIYKQDTPAKVELKQQSLFTKFRRKTEVANHTLS